MASDSGPPDTIGINSGMAQTEDLKLESGLNVKDLVKQYDSVSLVVCIASVVKLLLVTQLELS